MLASFPAAKIMRSQAKQNLELKVDVLTESICRWEDMNIRLLHIISQEPSSDIPAAEEWISFIVSDTGIGIKTEKIERVFQAFTQADESTTRRYGFGTRNRPEIQSDDGGRY